MPTDLRRAATIARLNEKFRFTGRGGEIFMTAGVAALPLATQQLIMETVQMPGEFGPDNDPYFEGDFQAMSVHGHRVFWKIDYYPPDDDPSRDPDPADPAAVKRVLTVMLLEEY
jgi:hypothetical protein